MPTFAYKAIDLQGTFVDGQVEAEDRAELIRLLQEDQLFLVSAHTDQELLSVSASAAPASVPSAPVSNATDKITAGQRWLLVVIFRWCFLLHVINFQKCPG